MYQRNIQRRLAAALADTRVVLLNGARQTGKSTLAQQLVAQRGGQYLTLDDPAIAAVARTDPAALLSGGAGFTVIDEVQSAPALFPALKREADRRPSPGRLLLTGSANVFMLPAFAESLAGRMEILTLEPRPAGLNSCGLPGGALVPGRSFSPVLLVCAPRQSRHFST